MICMKELIMQYTEMKNISRLILILFIIYKFQLIKVYWYLEAQFCQSSSTRNFLPAFVQRMSRSVKELLTVYKTLNREVHISNNIDQPSDSKRQKLNPPMEQQKTKNTTSGSSNTSQKQKRVVSVIFQGQEGFANSVTHYYHFLFAISLLFA